MSQLPFIRSSEFPESVVDSSPSYPPPDYHPSHADSRQSFSRPTHSDSTPPRWEPSAGESRVAQLYPYGIYHDAGIDNYERGLRFCEMHPQVNPPLDITYEQLDALRTHGTGVWTLIAPSQFEGKIGRRKDGITEVKTSYSSSSDKTLVSSLPVLWGKYNPKNGAKGVYFEVHIEKLGRNAVVAVGFGCLPYPTDFRLPGWHRHSAAVHSDDGFKFFENPMGGVPFTDPIKKGGIPCLRRVIM